MTQEQIENFIHNQQSRKIHPLTCDRVAPECEVNQKKGEGILLPKDGQIICPCGKYIQNQNLAVVDLVINKKIV